MSDLLLLAVRNAMWVAWAFLISSMALGVLQKISIAIQLHIDTTYIQLQSAPNDIFPDKDFA